MLEPRPTIFSPQPDRFGAVDGRMWVRCTAERYVQVNIIERRQMLQEPRPTRSLPSTEIIRFVPGFPFNVATDARPLFGRDRFIGQNRLHRGSQIVSAQWPIV